MTYRKQLLVLSPLVVEDAVSRSIGSDESGVIERESNGLIPDLIGNPFLNFEYWNFVFIEERIVAKFYD
jgi:hypothetical protein